MGNIIKSKCSCGEKINVEQESENSCRSDNKRPFYDGAPNGALQFRCRKCGSWLADSCPAAKWGKRVKPLKKALAEKECLEWIARGETAGDLLFVHTDGLEERWEKMCEEMRQYLAEVKKTFPDASYYTASGGFNLMLGSPHNSITGKSQSQLVALSSENLSIGDGDF